LEPSRRKEAPNGIDDALTGRVGGAAILAFELRRAARRDARHSQIKLRWPLPLLFSYERKSQAALSPYEQERFLCAFSTLVSNPPPYGWLGPFVDFHDMFIAVGITISTTADRYWRGA
jgi:hypothetical protein